MFDAREKAPVQITLIITPFAESKKDAHQRHNTILQNTLNGKIYAVKNFKRRVLVIIIIFRATALLIQL